MYIGYIEDRKCMGYDVVLDTSCGIKLVSFTNSALLMIKNFPSKVNGKTKRIIGVVSIAVAINFSNVGPAEAIPSQIVRVHQPSYEYGSEVKIAPTVNPGLDKIRLIATNKMIPLIYINSHYSSIKNTFLNKLFFLCFQRRIILLGFRAHPCISKSRIF